MEHDALIAAFYRYAMEPEGWTGLIAELDRLLSARVHLLWTVGQHGEIFKSVPSPQFDWAYENSYIAHYSELDIRVHMARHRPEGKWRSCHELWPEGLVRRHPFFQEFLLPVADVRWTTGIRLEVADGIHALIGVQRAPEQQPCGEQELRDLHALTPHLRQALAIAVKLRSLEQRAEMGEAALNRLDFGVLLTEVNGRVVFANRNAEGLLQRNDVLALRMGHLHAGPQTDALLAVVRAAVGGKGTAVAIQRPSGRHGLQVLVAPLSPRVVRYNFLQRPLAMLVVTDPELQALTPADYLSQLYGLTAAESRLTLGLLGGMTLEEHGERLGISKRTVRSQLNSIFSKTATRRQSELMRVLGGIPSIVS